MAKQLERLNQDLQEFIKAQKMFFVATARSEGRINLSPKGMNTFRILGPNRIVWLNLTGSGNETAAHLLENDRMTILFNAFEGKPLILRLYGNAKIHHQRDAKYQELIGLFPDFLGARQVIELEIDLVQTSCGFGVPLMSYQGDRSLLTEWAERKGKAGLKEYWKEKNTRSIDGFETNIL